MGFTVSASRWSCVPSLIASKTPLQRTPLFRTKSKETAVCSDTGVGGDTIGDSDTKGSGKGRDKAIK